MDGGYVNQCKDDLTEAYIRSIAAAAGCWVQQVARDYDGIDVMLRHASAVATLRSP